MNFATPDAINDEISVVATTWKQVRTAPTPCGRIWVGAPTADHPHGPNSGPMYVMISKAAPTSLKGARQIPTDGSKDRYFHVKDASRLWFYGFSSGDALEFCIELRDNL